MTTTYDPLTLAGLVQQWVSTRPDFRVVTIEGAGVRDDETRTYAQLWERGQRLAAGLQALGVVPGDKIGTLMANHVEFVDLMVAGSLMGFALVPIDPRTKGDKLAYMLAAAGCKGVIAADYALPEALVVRKQVTGVQWVAGLPTDEGKATGAQMQTA